MCARLRSGAVTLGSEETHLHLLQPRFAKYPPSFTLVCSLSGRLVAGNVKRRIKGLPFVPCAGVFCVLLSTKSQKFA